MRAPWWPTILGLEGLDLTNDPVDPGRRTYMGISERYQPRWIGWSQIDAGDWYIATASAYQWYFERWHYLCCPDFTHEGLAMKLFDQSVLFGVSRPVKWLQEALATLTIATIPIDGLIGPRTLATIALLKPSGAQAAQVLMGHDAANLHLANDAGPRSKYLAGHLIRAGRIYS